MTTAAAHCDKRMMNNAGLHSEEVEQGQNKSSTNTPPIGSGSAPTAPPSHHKTPSQPMQSPSPSPSPSPAFPSLCSVSTASTLRRRGYRVVRTLRKAIYGEVVMAVKLETQENVAIKIACREAVQRRQKMHETDPAKQGKRVHEDFMVRIKKKERGRARRGRGRRES